MENGKGRGEVRGMSVRGIILKMFFPIPLTIIPLTLACCRKTFEEIARKNFAL